MWLALAVSLGLQFVGTEDLSMGMMVKATREGEIGGTTSSGYIVDRFVPYVALPSTNALGRFVRIKNPANGRQCFAVVLDIGPWNIHDDNYVLGGGRPQAESGFDATGRQTNRAGIDLGEVVWNRLGMLDNTCVEWEFLV